MPNVKLRTIANNDNTIFQVQRADGSWTELTWDMISDKPFNELDDLVFTVTPDGVLTITNMTMPHWMEVQEKPFIALNPQDFTVDDYGVLHYTGSTQWSAITGKPFTTIDTDDFEVDDGKLKVIHQPIPNQNWSQIQGKPFAGLDSGSFSVVGGILYVNAQEQTVRWNDILNKPFDEYNPLDFIVEDGVIKVIHQSIPNQNWNQIQNKPFSYYNPEDFEVDNDTLKIKNGGSQEVVQQTLMMINNASNPITDIDTLQKYVLFFLKGTLENYFNVTTPTQGYFSPFMLIGAENQVAVELHVSLEGYREMYFPMIKYRVQKLWESSEFDTYYVMFNVSNMPSINSTDNVALYTGYLQFRIFKSGDSFTDVDLNMQSCTEVLGEEFYFG